MTCCNKKGFYVCDSIPVVTSGGLEKELEINNSGLERVFCFIRTAAWWNSHPY